MAYSAATPDPEAADSMGAVLVTGASSGIGRACALRLDRLGFEVFAGVRTPVDGESLRRESSARLTPVVLDVTDEDSIRGAVATVAEALGGARLVGLVNNAGITIWGPIEFIPPGELRRQFEINVLGQIALTQLTLPLLRASGGRVVNIGSMSGRVSLPFYGPYAASKFALEALTDAMRVELRPWGIHVCLVEPGIVATSIWEKVQAEGGGWMEDVSPELVALYGRGIDGVRCNARRLARAALPPETVARAVTHALTARRPKSRYRVAQSVHTRALLLLGRLPPRLRDPIIAHTLPKYP